MVWLHLCERLLTELPQDPVDFELAVELHAEARRAVLLHLAEDLAHCDDCGGAELHLEVAAVGKLLLGVDCLAKGVAIFEDAAVAKDLGHAVVGEHRQLDVLF